MRAALLYTPHGIIMVNGGVEANCNHGSVHIITFRRRSMSNVLAEKKNVQDAIVEHTHTHTESVCSIRNKLQIYRMYNAYYIIYYVLDTRKQCNIRS